MDPHRLRDRSKHEPCDSSECSHPPPTPLPPPPPSSPPGSHGRTTFATALIIAAPALVFLILCLFVFLFVRRRRQRRRRREALLEAALAPAAPAATSNDGGGGVPDLEEAEGEVEHHAWHIRTVGLDEAAIESIAITRYRAGAGGVPGASDCAVCLGEFTDGELLRLLPRCAHAFHVRCIDTWLRAHVNCPLCRSHVLDPAPAAAEEPDSPAGTDADTGQAASSIRTTEHEQLDQQAREQRELRLQIDQNDDRATSPEQPHRHPGPRGSNFRRVVSMDSPSPIASAEEAAPEDEKACGEKQGTGGADHCELLSPGCSGRPNNHRGMKRSLSVGSRWALVSRHCRRSSSLLPLWWR